MEILILVLAFWPVCSFLAYGITLGAFTHRFPDQTHLVFSVLFSIFGGPVSLFVSIVLSLAMNNHLHFKIKPLTTEQRWVEFDKKYGPWLKRDYFDRHRA